MNKKNSICTLRRGWREIVSGNRRRTQSKRKGKHSRDILFTVKTYNNNNRGCEFSLELKHSEN